MSRDTFERIQAILLNSEGNPREEVQQAVDAVVSFAAIECDMPLDDILELVRKSFDTTV